MIERWEEVKKISDMDPNDAAALRRSTVSQSAAFHLNLELLVHRTRHLKRHGASLGNKLRRGFGPLTTPMNPTPYQSVS